MLKKTVSGIILTFLLVSTLSSAFHVVTSTMDRTSSIQHGETVGEGESREQWNKTYGGALSDSAESAVQTIDGGYAIAGDTSSFGAGGADFWLIKTDVYGNVEWNKTYGGTGNDIAKSVVQTVDGGYAITGYTLNLDPFRQPDFLLVKADANGNMEWNKTYGGAEPELGYSVVQTVDGGYAITGRQGQPWSDARAWLVKTDANGNVQWNATYLGDFESGAYSIIQSSDGGYVIAGYSLTFHLYYDTDFWLVKTDVNGNVEWDRMYGGADIESAHSVVQTADGGYVVTGYTWSFGAGDADYWLVKADANGNMEWNKTYGGQNYESACTVLQTDDGGYGLAGFTESFGAGDADYWLVKTDANGNMEWNKTYGEIGTDHAESAVQTIDGGYAIAGYTNSSGAGDYDFWLVKIVPYHDVSLVNMMPSKTVVGQGFPVSINVTVENQGFYTENLNITAYADLVVPPVGNEITIGRQVVFNLQIGEARNVTFRWDTVDLAKGNYTLNAVIDALPDDVDLADNIYTSGIVTIVVVGDIIPDGTIDIFDLVAVATWFGSHVPPAPSNSDIIEDKLIDIYDLVTVAIHYGEADP